MLMEKAWLVAMLNSNGKYELGIYSEENPSIMCGHWTAQVASGRGHDYASARKDLLRWIKHHLPKDIAQYGDDDVRKAVGLKPRHRPFPAQVTGVGHLPPGTVMLPTRGRR